MDNGLPVHLKKILRNPCRIPVIENPVRKPVVKTCNREAPLSLYLVDKAVNKRQITVYVITLIKPHTY